MNLTKVLLPTTVTLAVFLTVMLVYPIVTLNLSPTTVSFSLQVTFTVFDQLPIVVDLATIHNFVAFPPFNLSIIQLTV